MSSQKKFGDYGGEFAPETLMYALEELDGAFNEAVGDREFLNEFDHYLREFAGRPTPLYFAGNLSGELNCRVYLKREDLVHGGAHKLNNTLGQALLAKRMGKTRVIAETGAGQHGVATAISGAMLGLKVEVYMGAEDVERQKLNVFRMNLLGAKVHAVHSGSKTLKDAINEAIRDWITNVETTYYLFGTVAGMHPYPTMVREFQSVIGRETKKQIMEAEGKLPDAILACVGGGSNAMGIFSEFIGDEYVKLFAVEAGGKGIESGKHGASLFAGTDGVFHGMYTKLIQDKYGQIKPTHSIAPGLDYPGVGPQLAYLHKTGRITAAIATDDEALNAFRVLSELEGIIPALESAHAVAHLLKIADEFDKDDIIIVNLSGRGDKDVHTVAARMGVEL
ncbi:MAG: tryptophan synthase subunit beta [Candidatus Altiarchaeales archaeon WOR_SM1_86-2]|nr:MAG: tryptophan synthase subunit beta [Candidatus Altiarchaeales archaeon WOR_SM1_86-2]